MPPGRQELGTGVAPSDAFGLKSLQGLLGKMPFLFQITPERLSPTKTNPELTTAENYPDTSIPLGRGAQFTR